MNADRWDPEMRAARQAMDEAAAQLPPVLLAEPFDVARAINEHLTMMTGQGGSQKIGLHRRHDCGSTDNGQGATHH